MQQGRGADLDEVSAPGRQHAVRRLEVADRGIVAVDGHEGAGGILHDTRDGRGTAGRAHEIPSAVLVLCREVERVRERPVDGDRIPLRELQPVRLPESERIGFTVALGRHVLIGLALGVGEQRRHRGGRHRHGQGDQVPARVVADDHVPGFPPGGEVDAALVRRDVLEDLEVGVEGEEGTHGRHGVVASEQTRDLVHAAPVGMGEHVADTGGDDFHAFHRLTGLGADRARHLVGLKRHDAQRNVDGDGGVERVAADDEVVGIGADRKVRCIDAHDDRVFIARAGGGREIVPQHAARLCRPGQRGSSRVAEFHHLSGRERSVRGSGEHQLSRIHGKDGDRILDVEVLPGVSEREGRGRTDANDGAGGRRTRDVPVEHARRRGYGGRQHLGESLSPVARQLEAHVHQAGSGPADLLRGADGPALAADRPRQRQRGKCRKRGRAEEVCQGARTEGAGPVMAVAGRIDVVSVEAVAGHEAGLRTAEFHPVMVGDFVVTPRGIPDADFVDGAGVAVGSLPGAPGVGAADQEFVGVAASRLGEAHGRGGDTVDEQRRGVRPPCLLEARGHMRPAPDGNRRGAFQRGGEAARRLETHLAVALVEPQPVIPAVAGVAALGDEGLILRMSARGSRTHPALEREVLREGKRRRMRDRQMVPLVGTVGQLQADAGVMPGIRRLHVRRTADADRVHRAVDAPGISVQPPALYHIATVAPAEHGQRDAVQVPGGRAEIDVGGPDTHFVDLSGPVQSRVVALAVRADAEIRIGIGQVGLAGIDLTVERAVDVEAQVVLERVEAHRHVRPGVDGDGGGPVPEILRIRIIPEPALCVEAEPVAEGAVVSDDGHLAAARRGTHPGAEAHGARG